MVSLPSSNFWNSILMFHFSFHKPFITPFISTLVAKEIICLPVSFQLSSCKFSIPTDILIIRSLIQSRIMTIIPKQLLMCPKGLIEAVNPHVLQSYLQFFQPPHLSTCYYLFDLGIVLRWPMLSRCRP